MIFAYRNNRHLYRREPRRKRAGVVLDQDAKKSFYRTHDRAVDHDWPFFRAISISIQKTKPFRHVEINLNCGKLPLAANRILDHKVKFGSIKCGLTNPGLICQFFTVQELSERALGSSPNFLPPQI